MLNPEAHRARACSTRPVIIQSAIPTETTVAPSSTIVLTVA